MQVCYIGLPVPCQFAASINSSFTLGISPNAIPPPGLRPATDTGDAAHVIGSSVPAAHFLEQIKHECYFSNGTERMRFVQRLTHTRRSMRASTATWESSGRWQSWSGGESRNGISQKNLLGYLRGLLDTYCRHNCGVSLTAEQGIVARACSPSYFGETQPLQHRNLLVCSVSGFYLDSIKVRWFWNGQKEKAVVTFQTLVMLETVLQSGEVYTCQVEHPSVTSPLTSEPAQSKMLSGVGGFVLGLLFPGAGLFIYFRNQKGEEPLGAGSLHRLFWRKKYGFPEISSRCVSGLVLSLSFPS
uniref:Ig-like domain-containing protein n=1 Tax=Theropithecus gelada TaxID=9565 RepID=A0A8D2GKT5_THEGE